MSLALTDLLQDRACLLQTVRSFFKERSVLEVDCCALVRHASLDSNVEVMSAALSESETAYLHTSPEYAMKRLLCEGSGDIYYLGHVYRKSEIGRLHNPEFTMIEWYRVGMEYEKFIEETCSLLMLFLGQMPVRLLSYRQAFLDYLGIDPFEESDLQGTALRLGLEPPRDCLDWDRDTWLHLLLSHAIEPQLGQGELTVLLEYPPSQAALSRLVQKERLVAKRFEIYCQGIELSNGYHELSDAKEQRLRFEAENRARKSQGKEAYSLDERFLSALEKGLPDCCGVSVGFDRLMLLRHRQKALSDVLPFSWT